MERNNMKNYRPISNFVFISKLIERAVATEVNQHVHNNKLGDAYDKEIGVLFEEVLCRLSPSQYNGIVGGCLPVQSADRYL